MCALPAPVIPAHWLLAIFLAKGLSVPMLERSTDVYLPTKTDEYWCEDWKEVSREPQYVTKTTGTMLTNISVI